jgi:hypothetical protein
MAASGVRLVTGYVALVVAKDKLPILGFHKARATIATVHAAKVIRRNFDVDGYPLAGIAHILPRPRATDEPEVAGESQRMGLRDM